MQEQTAAVHQFLGVLNAEADLAGAAVAALGRLPVNEWPAAFAAHPEWLSFGPLDALLDIAHAEIDNDARRAEQIARFVLEYAPRISPPDGAEILGPLLLGTACKDHANALAELHAYEPAMAAVRRAIEIFESVPALAVDRAAALLTCAQIAHELGHTVDALALVEEASTVFLTHRETRRYLQALEVSGHILFDQGQYEDALEVFSRGRTVAGDYLDDAYAVARMDLNLGQTAIFLDPRHDATAYLARALAYFEDRGVAGAVHRAIWGIAREARQRGELEEARDAFYHVYGEFLHHGRYRAAASVLVELADTVTKLTGDATYGRDVCRQLAKSVEQYDVSPAVREAVFYLQREADSDSAVRLRDALRIVAKHLDTLLGSPSAAFSAA